MNIQLIEDKLGRAKGDMIEALDELENAHSSSRFQMFAPLCRRARTITSKIAELETFIKDLKNVRCGG